MYKITCVRSFPRQRYKMIKIDYLADHTVLASIIGILLCCNIISFIGCLISIKIFLKKLHQLVKRLVIFMVIQQLLDVLILIIVYLTLVTFKIQNWLTCSLFFNTLNASEMLRNVHFSEISIIR